MLGQFQQATKFFSYKLSKTASTVLRIYRLNSTEVLMPTENCRDSPMLIDANYLTWSVVCPSSTRSGNGDYDERIQHVLVDSSSQLGLGWIRLSLGKVRSACLPSYVEGCQPFSGVKK